MPLNKVWVEEYRPKSIKDVVFASDAERANFERIVETRSLPNLMLLGPPGTGKSSISGSLLNDLGVRDEDVLSMNCSNEKIDGVRDKVLTFAYTMAMGDFKVVQLEEFDNIGQDAQKLLRSVVEEVGNSCRFIITGNYANRIIPAMQDRFETYNMNRPDRDLITIRCAEILEKEGVEFEVDDLLKVIEAGYPSVRRSIMLLEQSSRSGKLVIQGEGAIADWKLQLLPLIETGDFKSARKLVCESASREELQDVYRFLVANLHRMKKIEKKQDEAIVLIAQYQYQHSFVSDPEIQVAALFIELGAL
jgi:DNA polymerase III delta prime subunit